MTKAKMNVGKKVEAIKEKSSEKPTQQEMVLTKSTLVWLVNSELPNLLEEDIRLQVANLPDNDFWERLNQLNWNSILPQVKVKWIQQQEGIAPEIAFVCPNFHHFIKALMDEIVSISVFHQVTSMKKAGNQMPLHENQTILYLLTRLYVLASIALNALIKQQEQKMDK